MIPTQELERLKARFYREFHEQNPNLFRSNRQEYFRKQRLYVERKVHEATIERAKAGREKRA